MKLVRIVGVLLVVAGAVLMVVGFIPVQTKHEANVLGLKMSVTEKEERRVPLVVSGSILGAGVLLLVVSAAGGKRG